MSFKRYRIIFILIFMLTSDGTHNVIMANDIETASNIQQQHTLPNELENAQSDNKEGRALFPRLEYTNEWTPVGKGDPLKDPTFDYMPPVLDRVRYWGEGTSNKNKNDILVLGVPSKKHSSMNKKEKYTFNGPIKRNFYSMPFQSHYSSPHHHHHPPQQQQQLQQQQQQQYHPKRLIPPQHRTHVASDLHSHSMMSTHHYSHQQQQQQYQQWKNNNNIQHTEPRPESSIHHKTVVRPPVTTHPTRHPSNAPFLPTVLPPLTSSTNLQEHSSSTPTLPMSQKSGTSPATTTAIMEVIMNGQMPFTSSSSSSNNNGITGSSSSKETTKPLLHSILQTETAAPFSFTMKPSSIYQIEYTSNIYNPEAINSMATSSSTTAFVPYSSSPEMPMKITTTTTTTKSPVRPIKTTTKMTISTSERDELKHYVQPDMHSAWPVYNLIIEGHSKVKTYGLKNDDPLAHSMPKIRPIQASKNPIVEHVTAADEGPEFKRKIQNQHQPQQKQQTHRKESTMESLLSLLDGSFGNFLTDETKSQYEGSGGDSKRKTKRSITQQTVRDDNENEGKVNNKQERVVGVSFQVDERPQVYRRKGTVISENLWPFRNADTSR